MEWYKCLAQAIADGDEIQVLKTVRKLLSRGAVPTQVIYGLVAGMDNVGDMFRKSEMFIPDVLMSARAMNEGLGLVRRIRKIPARRPMGKVVLGTVKGDIHDIGKNLVGMMLESGGYLVYDLGVNVEPQLFVDAVIRHKANILALSAQLTTTMLNMKYTIDAIKAAGMNDRVKVIIGGLPTSQDFADQIGADGYALDASSAVYHCKKLLESNISGELKRGPILRIVKRQRRDDSDT